MGNGLYSPVTTAIAFVSAFAALLALSPSASSHIADRPDLDQWFMHLKSKNSGLCCDFMEAKKVADPDWDTKDGHYRVFYEGKWWDVPDAAVVTEPNRYGPALLWPLEYTDGNGKKQMYGIQCFMPGAGT